MSFESRLDVFFDLHPQRATLNGELHCDGNDTFGRNRFDCGHAQVDDVVAQFGVHDRFQAQGDFRNARRCCSRGQWLVASHGLNLPSGRK